MVEKVRDSDYIIVVLTENYSRKADAFEGGVGFESQLTLPLIMENPDKLVFIMRHKGDFNKVFPFHFKGQYAIDFTSDDDYDVKFDELIYRLYQKPRFYVEPVGEAPILEPKIPSRIKQTNEEPNNLKNTEATDWDFTDIEIPNLRRITDREIERFLKDSYKQIIQLFNSLFTKVQAANPNFEFDQHDINNYKTVFSLYVDGQSVNGIKIWLGGVFGRNNINLLYSRHMDYTTDNSMNEMISFEITDKNQLQLKMTMNMLGNRNSYTPEEIVKEIWKNHISHSIR